MSFPEYAHFEHIPSIIENSIGEIADECPDVISQLDRLEWVQSAGTFAGLLVMPKFQPNCIRLEALVHLAVLYCEGKLTPTTDSVTHAFDQLNEGYCGRMEDPTEDEFVALVNTPRGNYRVFQGIREGTAFYLQRILNVVESMPDRPPFKSLRESVESLLKLSDAVATRAGVMENILGNETPFDAFPAEEFDKLPGVINYVRLSKNEMMALGIARESLADFEFSLDDKSQVRTQRAGNTDLERRPVVFCDGFVYLLLPTAVASAITRLVIESMASAGRLATLESALAAEYGRLFHETPILGKRLPGPVVFQKIPGGGIASAIAEIDSGRFLDLIFFLDGLDGFAPEALNGMNADPKSISEALRLHLDLASAEIRKRKGFRDVMALFVNCGFGRALMLELDTDLPDHCRLECIGAHDLVTLSWLSGFDALSIWRLFDAREALEREGVVLVNVNGLVNLVAWSRELSGHLVPHGNLPDEFIQPGHKSVIGIRQNALRALRHDVITEWNPRRVLDVDGRWVKVRKLDKSSFDEDNTAPLYGSEEDARNGKLRAVYLAPKRSWWIEIVSPESAPRESVFQDWMMLCVWVKRAAPVLEEVYESLPLTPLSLRVTFEEIVGITRGEPEPKNLNELRSLVQVFAERGSGAIQILVKKGFQDGFFQAENVAERVLVEAIVKGAATASDESPDQETLESCISRICPNSQARWIHRFQARLFRDYVGAEITNDTTLIDPIDDAALRIGLGWRARSRDKGANITGVGECTAYLNDVVRIVIDDLCALLQTLDRDSFVTELIVNHETAAHDRDVWKRTAQANLALHDDKERAISAIIEHHAQLNGCFLASRILMEAAICECPVQGGRIPGRMDLSRAMALAVQAHHYGGWSDAIHWGAVESHVRITPLGDVHIKHDFIDAVYEPFGRTVGEDHVKQDTDSYSELYAEVKVLPSIYSTLERQFLDAWQAEFGVNADGFRTFLDKLEDIDREPAKAFSRCRRSVLAQMLATSAGTSTMNAHLTLDMLTLRPRPAWRVVSEQFVDKDWFPWRFRRRLSVLRRPFIQIDCDDDPTILVAPALVRDAVLATMRSFHSGEVPSWQTRSDEMRKWIGHSNHVHRTDFNSRVAVRMRELGWQAKAEVTVNQVLGRSLDRNYGDIDVLAWRPETGRVLVMECKDLHFNKTLGEVAEQLADFRGEIRPDGKRDPLRKHLDRLDILVEQKDTVARTLKLASPVQIEGHLVFRNPVPMRFAWERMANKIQLSLFAELDRL